MARRFQDCAILLGDSLTSRQDVPWSLQARFCSVYRRTLDVLNRGFGSYNTSFHRPLMDEIFAKVEDVEPATAVRLITLWIGSNDSVPPEFPTGQAVDIATYRANIEKYLYDFTSPDSTYSVAHQDQPLNIILITPPPLLPSMYDPAAKKRRRVEWTNQYRLAMVEIGKKWTASSDNGGRWKVGLVDLWDAIEKEAGGLGEELAPFFVDGVHLSAQGYDVLWREISVLIGTEFKGRGIDWTENVKAGGPLPWTVPNFEDLDHSHTDNGKLGMTGPYRRGVAWTGSAPEFL